MFEPVSEHSDVLTAIIKKMLVTFAMRSVVLPISFILIDSFVDKFASALYFRVVDLALIKGSVGEDQKSMIIFSLSIIIFSVIESSIGVNGVAFAVWKSAHPISLVKSFFRVHVISINSCIVGFDVDQLLIFNTISRTFV